MSFLKDGFAVYRRQGHVAAQKRHLNRTLASGLYPLRVAVDAVQSSISFDLGYHALPNFKSLYDTAAAASVQIQVDLVQDVVIRTDLGELSRNLTNASASVEISVQLIRTVAPGPEYITAATAASSSVEISVELKQTVVETGKHSEDVQSEPRLGVVFSAN